MVEWGISAASHNAALAVFKNKELVFAAEAERYSKLKNDPDLNLNLVNDAYKFGKPDAIYWYENPKLKFIRQILSGQYLKPLSIKRYLKRYGISAPVKTCSHHLSHAAAGYFTSPFNDACIIVIDAIGEFDTLTIWNANNNELNKVYSLKYPNSIGLWYSAMTQRCGLKPNEEEYILMGMSALGNYNKLYRSVVNDFIDLYNIKIKQNLHRGCKWWRGDLSSPCDIFDIAAATQHIYQRLFVSVLKKGLELTNSKNLVLGGGCALNCAANSIAYSYFKNVWIVPAPGDNGSAIGAVLAHYKHHIKWPGPFLGHNIKVNSTNDEIVNYLLNHKICGIARGPAEFGPRALGNRSLIADPRGSEIKDKVNEIKHREKFRPFAPVILEEEASKYFSILQDRPSPYMQFTYQCLYPNKFPAIVHYDYTSRVQTVAKDGSLIRDLLEKWFAKTGCPMLLNTSLNIKGEPMLNDLDDVKRWEAKYKVKIFS